MVFRIASTFEKYALIGVVVEKGISEDAPRNAARSGFTGAGVTIGRTFELVFNLTI